MDARLLEILVCPLCKGPLQYDRAVQELICSADKLAYPIQDGIPVMLADEARTTVEGRRVDPAGPSSASTSVSASVPGAPTGGSTAADTLQDTPHKPNNPGA